MYRKMVIVTVGLLLIAALVLSPGVGCTLLDKTSTDSEPDFTLLKEAWDIIYDEYVEQDKLDAETLIRGAVKGMVDSIEDPYSAFLDPEA